MITLISLIACVGISSAGEGGFVYLINLSGSDWIRTHHDSQAMNNWGFPKLVKDKSEVHVYIEFSYVPFARISHARVDYKLVGTEGKRFHIVALENPRRLEAVYDNLETDGQPLGMRRNLGWRREGDTNLIIIGKNGTYTGTCLNGSNWMKNNMDILGSRTLKQISIPGSHHSGMSKLDGNTDFGRPCTVLTQSNNIEEQLHLGIRYFDIRPVIANSNLFLTGHYTQTNGSWEGANGQSITSIVSDLNVFTKDHNELIIMKLSHPLNIDVKSKIYRKFNQTDWNKMFLQLDKITHLYTNEISYVNLTDITLNDYTKHGSRASVVIIVDDPDSNVELGSRLGRVYFKPSNLDMYDDPSGNNDWSEMIDDQIKKMHQHSQNKYFLLSWTLTQSALQAAMCIPSLRELADLANIQLGKSLYSEASASSYPNIILVDNVKDTNVASLALAINTKIML